MLNNFFKTEKLTLLALSLSPLSLIISSTLNAMVVGSIFFFVLLLSSILLSAMKGMISYGMRLPVILVLVSCIVTATELFISAFYYEWTLILGIYIPLLSMNCLILANAEENILTNSLRPALVQTVGDGIAVWGILLLIGMVKDYLSAMGIVLNSASSTFFILGFIFALIQYMNLRMAEEH